MKRYFILATTLIFCFYAQSQGPAKAKAKKYPSLFWEISGNGLKKPSYLFGTMHVSSKLAFNLADSFYLAIKNSEVVALETNPETWQEDMNNYDLGSSRYRYGFNPELMNDMPNDFLNIKTLRFGKYEKKLEVAMFSKPSMINNLLYRSMSENTSDFEEDTYLDLYIYQTGKKLGKKVAGVEQYEQSMKLMAEAFRDAAKEKNKKEKSFDYDEDFSPAKLQDAYRAGNLDQLDSINKLNSQSDAFDEKFLYRRNEIQANSIDSILKRSSLFVGVGAAHLPGNRGVIELLRRKGYKLRPIYMGTRDSKQKDAVEKVRVPVSFSTQTADDGFYKVDIPGKFYRFGENFLFDQQQYADMANGSFYMVTRVKTNSLYWGHNADVVAKKIDSLLYENVPGKILSKTEITKSGYKGYDITSRTRRGDYNRYNIFITPFEVIFFKMGGNGEYIKNGDEAKQFFNSIQLKEYKNGGWKKFQPDYGGFSIDFPQQPYESFGDNVQYDAEEKSTGQHFSVIRTDIHNYRFVEEDTFDLALMDESFGSADYIEKNIARKQLVYKGYPALDCQYKHKNGSVIFTRFLIQGPHYYTLVSHGKNENNAAEKFFNSFEFTPFVYKELRERKDTAMYFSVKTPWFPEEKKNKVDLPDEDSYVSGADDDDDNYYSLTKDDYKTRLVKNDTTGEAVYITFSRTSKYEYVDSTLMRDNKYLFMPGFDTTWIIRSAKKSTLPNGIKVMEQVVSDTNSSRAILTKTFYREGLYFQLTTETDTLSQPSRFVRSFFENFVPADTLKIISPFTKKSKVFFDDFFGNDSIARKKAINSIWQIEMDSTDLPLLTKAINSFKWSEKKYLERKISFINKLGDIPVKASADILKDIYYAAGDTVQLQHAALAALVNQETQYSINLFKNIITSEPPVLDTENSNQNNYRTYSYRNIYTNSGLSGGGFLNQLYDSLQLTRTILPDMLPLMTLDDYKKPIMHLLRKMVDSNLVKAKDYEIYYSKFLIEAKQQLKKQAIEEKKSAIEKAEGEKTETKTANLYRRNDGDRGNEDLITYATLLLPFRETNPAVKEVLKQMLSSNDKRLKYNTAYLLLQHKISLPDTMLMYFAKLDDFRYELFTDMRTLKMLDKFPAEYKNQRDLSKSKLFSSSSYSKPDSLVFIDSLPASLKNSKGFVFFYKYKTKKDDLSWRLATAGLLSQDNNPFNYDDDEDDDEDDDDDIGYTSIMSGWNFNKENNKIVVTEFTDEKIKEDVPLKEQMEKQLKKILYSKRKSAKMFYNEGPDYSDMSFRYLE
ncbi:MAG TPA: TraB/GumN family protein [Chitinophagaceae bacterium]|nr:TraB/GumN family protein [Chitinophagaceae bacterium]